MEPLKGQVPAGIQQVGAIGTRPQWLHWLTHSPLNVNGNCATIPVDLKRKEAVKMTETGFWIFFVLIILLVVIVAVVVTVSAVSGATAAIVDDEEDEEES